MAYIRKRGNRWAVEVDRRGVTAHETFGTKTAAQVWARKIEADIDAGLTGGVSARPFKDALARYVREVSPTKRGEAWERKRLTALEADALADVPMNALDAPHVAAWRDRRLAVVSGSTVNREWNLLSHVCTVATNEWRWLRGNPFATVRRPKDAPARSRLPTADEIEALRIASGYHDGVLALVEQRVFAAFLFAIETGMRSGEICALRDVRGRVAFLPMTKNGEARQVPLSAEALRIWQQAGPFEMTPSQRDAVWRKLRAKAGVVGLNFHDSRHLAVTLLAKKIGVLELARMIGHRNISQLMTYYNPTSDSIAELLDVSPRLSVSDRGNG